jgi:hypothetical protein
MTCLKYESKRFSLQIRYNVHERYASKDTLIIIIVLLLSLLLTVILLMTFGFFINLDWYWLLFAC